LARTFNVVSGEDNRDPDRIEVDCRVSCHWIRLGRCVGDSEGERPARLGRRSSQRSVL